MLRVATRTPLAQDLGLCVHVLRGFLPFRRLECDDRQHMHVPKTSVLELARVTSMRLLCVFLIFRDPHDMNC